MALTDQTALCQTGTPFVGRVRSAAAAVCLSILQEPPTANNDQTRRTFAARFVNDYADAIALRLALLVAANDAANDSTSDAALIARVAALWDAAAGLSTFQNVTLTTADVPPGTGTT